MRTITKKEKIENYDTLVRERNFYQFAATVLSREIPHKTLETEEDGFKITARLYGLYDPQYEGIVVLIRKSICYKQNDDVEILPLDKFYKHYWNDNYSLIRGRSAKMAEIALKFKREREKYFENGGK